MKEQKNIGLWIRVSTDMQVQDDSPEHHEKRARNYAEAKGWNVVTVYRLDALSGKSVMDYEETKRMLKDIQSGAISGIIFSKLARLARNTKELLEISEIFRNNNADLISLAEAIDTSTPAGRLFFTVIAAMAQWEREEIAERVAASVPIRAKMGKPLGGQAFFGYKWQGKEMVVDEKEAPVRKLMYELFAKIKRRKAVASELNKLGYRTRNGSLFTDTTVTRLLRDTSAKGVRKSNYTKSIGEGKRWIAKPEEDWVMFPCPSIIPESLWNECNQILDEQIRKHSKAGPRVHHLLSGYIYCECGKKMYVYHTAPVYTCKSCKTKIATNDIDEIYHNQLKSFLLTDSDAQSFMDQSCVILNEKESLLEASKNKRDKIKKEMDDLLSMRLDGELSKEIFPIHYKPLEEQYIQLENQLPDLEAEVDFLKIQSLSSDTILEEANDLYNGWKNLEFDAKRSVIETITEKITVGKQDIMVALAYMPTPKPYLSLKDGTKQYNH
jgi:site-specific DNA recombinase